MISLLQIARGTLQTRPYSWAIVDNLFSPIDATALAGSFPRDHFKTVAGYGGEKDYEYEARALVHLDAKTVSCPQELSSSWLSLAHDFLSAGYRDAVSSLTKCDLTTAPMEVNIFHYGPGGCLGPHVDLPDKLVTHVLYFNESWDREDGGCLKILQSVEPSDIAVELAPLIGSSCVLVRSQNSWHAVERVVEGCNRSRRSLTATFYRPGSVSTMWPPSDTTPLHPYEVGY